MLRLMLDITKMIVSLSYQTTEVLKLTNIIKYIVFYMLCLTSLLFHLLITEKSDVKMKIILVEAFFLIECSVKHLQPTTIKIVMFVVG